MQFLLVLMLTVLVSPLYANAAEPTRQLLVTFKNDHAQYQSAGFQPPYRARKRYAVSASVRRDAKAIAEEYSLTELEQWPLASLSVYCYVFGVADEASANIVAALSKDQRVESAQWLNTFQTQAAKMTDYNDTYVDMQHGLDTISLAQAHRLSRGEGVRVAVVDSDVDLDHEDLRGSMKRTDYLEHARYERDLRHGTAVASIIGAEANNALGIVGVAPDAMIEVAEACWLDGQSASSICDTFTLAKALDAMFLQPPDIINLSLNGPEDALLRRILQRLLEQNVVVIAAAATPDDASSAFPTSMSRVISVASIGEQQSPDRAETVFAPGEKILVAAPSNDYEFRSGISLATAHVSGIAALLKSLYPDMTADDIKAAMLRSQVRNQNGHAAVNACEMFKLVRAQVSCH